MKTLKNRKQKFSNTLKKKSFAEYNKDREKRLETLVFPKSEKRYFILENGAYPMIVYFSKNDSLAYVYGTINKWAKPVKPDTWEGLIPFRKFWVGDNLWNDKKEARKNQYPGNSLLFQEKFHSEKYVLINGNTIYYFTLPKNEKILSFHSPVGNSAVSYIYIIGKINTYVKSVDSLLVLPTKDIQSVLKKKNYHELFWSFQCVEDSEKNLAYCQKYKPFTDVFQDKIQKINYDKTVNVK